MCFEGVLRVFQGECSGVFGGVLRCVGCSGVFRG